MAILERDTLFYRWDHPAGFEFSGGNPEPDPLEGWSRSPDAILPRLQPAYEATTLEAFQNILDAERKGFEAEREGHRRQVAELRGRGDQLEAAVAMLGAQLRGQQEA